MAKSPAPFLTARWESLLLLNFSCPADLLDPLVPAGTELDSWKGTHLISLVGFQMIDTRVKGCQIPWHRHFEEVNLRFYVRRETKQGVRRGVVFVRELVPRRAIAAVARLVYNEPYTAVPMSHSINLTEETGGSVRYSWRFRGSEYSLGVTAQGPAQTLTRDSEAEFITEHYWGYNRQKNGSSMEYEVVHPPWKIWECDSSEYLHPSSDTRLYGPGFSEVLSLAPVSAHLAVGSEVQVFPGKKIVQGYAASGKRQV